MNIEEFFLRIGLKAGSHVVLHSSFSKIRKEFPGLTIALFIDSLKDIIGRKGSLIMPAFTYCYKKESDDYEVFDRESTPGKVGAVAEIFRLSEDTVRTSSPTHSFVLWGKAAREIGLENSPESPLGEGSVLHWLTEKQNSYLFLLGTDFSSLSYCHYIEVKAPVPWHDYFPWGFMGVEETGVSTVGEQKLRQLPGCSKSFTNFEKYLLNKKIIKSCGCADLTCYLMEVNTVYSAGILFFRNYPERLLCKKGSCDACDIRRKRFLNNPEEL